jgi:hypothetical protein
LRQESDRQNHTAIKAGAEPNPRAQRIKWLGRAVALEQQPAFCRSAEKRQNFGASNPGLIELIDRHGLILRNLSNFFD